MQKVKEYGQSLAPVNVSGAHGSGAKGRRGQLYRVCIRIGSERVRIVGGRRTLMGWVRLALAERVEKEAAAC